VFKNFYFIFSAARNTSSASWTKSCYSCSSKFWDKL